MRTQLKFRCLHTHHKLRELYNAKSLLCLNQHRAIKAQEWQKRALHSFFASALDGGQCSASARLGTEQGTTALMHRLRKKPDGPPKRSAFRGEEKISYPLPGIKPRFLDL